MAEARRRSCRVRSDGVAELDLEQDRRAWDMRHLLELILETHWVRSHCFEGIRVVGIHSHCMDVLPRQLGRSSCSRCLDRCCWPIDQYCRNRRLPLCLQNAGMRAGRMVADRTSWVRSSCEKLGIGVQAHCRIGLGAVRRSNRRSSVVVAVDQHRSLLLLCWHALPVSRRSMSTYHSH